MLDILLSSVPLDPADLSSGIIFTAQNITEKKQAERDLTASESRSENLIQTSPIGILIYQLDSQDGLILIEANPATETILGRDYSGSIGMGILDIFPNLAKTGIPESYRKVALTGQSWSTTDFEYEDERVTGAYDVLEANRAAVEEEAE